MENIKVGDRVRSYDFECRNAKDDGERCGFCSGCQCYIEGEVVELRPVDGCERYVVLVKRDIWENSVFAGPRVGNTVYPPVNGTPKLFGGVCDGVTKIA